MTTNVTLAALCAVNVTSVNGRGFGAYPYPSATAA